MRILQSRYRPVHYFFQCLLAAGFFLTCLNFQFHIACHAQTASAQDEFNDFRQKAEAYENELERNVQAVDADESQMKARYQLLEKQSQNASQLSKAKIFREIEHCRQAVARDEAQKQQANSYLLSTNEHLQRLKAKAQIEAHNMAADQEKAEEDRVKAAQAQAQSTWEKQVMSNSDQYRQQMNADDNYGGYGYGGRGRGRGRSYRNGRFYGYHYDPQPKAGSTSFPSAHAPTVHPSGGHHR
ncbi:MAG: hypothetical protein K2X81_05080 [Candidatus Obscuribacterales bacterium]|nr:hypothetical protein [Candidatus Obscuribacterales bacterium]